MAADRRSRLELLRDQLTIACDVAIGKDLAPLSRELRATLEELDALPAAEGSAPADEIAARREERRQRAAGG